MTAYTLEQLSSVIGVSRDAVKKRAARESWPYTEETCRGGRRRLYRICDLPTDVRKKVELFQAMKTAESGTEVTHDKRSQPSLAGDGWGCVGGVDHPDGKREAGVAGAVDGVLVAAGGADGGAARGFLPEPSGGGGGSDAVGQAAHDACATSRAGAVTLPATRDVAVATRDVALPASGGQSIQAGVPSTADTSPAATGAGGLTGGGGAGCAFAAGAGAGMPQGRQTGRALTGAQDAGNGALTRGAGSIPAAPAIYSSLIGELVAPVRPATESDVARIERARRIMAALQPLLMLPTRHRGRRAMAEEIAKGLGCSFQQVYRYEEKARVGGMDALVRMGSRTDRGVSRVAVSAEFEDWAALALAQWKDAEAKGFDLQRLAAMMRDKVRGAWVGGADGETQCWLKATAWLAKDLRAEGCPDGALAALLTLKPARRFLAAEGQHFRVAGKSRRDGKAIYDEHWTPVRRTARALMPGDLVCGDISPLDIPCLRPDGSVMYSRMISWHDVATNWMWVDLFPTAKGEGVRREHVAASFARMCEQAPFGAPKRLYLDNGSEYKWDDMLDAWHQLATLTGQQLAYEIAAMLPEAGRLVRSIPFHPRGKRIEGQFGNLRRWLAWWMGYVGGNRMTKKIVTMGKGVQLSRYEDVAEWLKSELADYHVTPQPRAEHMAGLSPQQKLEQALASGWKPARIDRGLLMLAFSERQWRTVNHGRVSWGGVWYRCDELMAVTGKVLCAKPRVYESWADCLLVFDRQGRQIGAAVPEYVYGMLDHEGAKESARRRQALRLLNADRIEQAQPLDVREVSGLRAELLGLDATLQRASDAAVNVEPSEEARLLMGRVRMVAEQAQAAQRRAEEAKQAENLLRLATEDDPDTAAARAMGF